MRMDLMVRLDVPLLLCKKVRSTLTRSSVRNVWSLGVSVL